ncbi:MAG TPA: hypothetical protein VK989_04965, partial [Polyangia bacterium]|nr:hypothetical protein [Polyangia bacterium]
MLLRALSLATGLSLAFITVFSDNLAMAALSPLTCSGSTWSSAVPTQFGAIQFDNEVDHGGIYISNTDLQWNLMLNSNVTDMQMHTPGFTTEHGYDYFGVARSGGTSTFTGVVGASWASLTPLGTYEKYVNPHWHTDGDNTGT